MSSITSQPPTRGSRMSHLSRETTSDQKDVLGAPLELTHNPTPYFLETPNERDRRIRNLFESLNRNGTGYLDSDCILKGFQQMTHLPARTKYARDLLEKCDTSQDGVIDYDEFKIYVEEREKELWAMFEEIDRSGDGRLQPEELEHALQRAGIRVTKDDFWQFMEAMDSDGNGVIDFQEWRDFLLLLPKETNITEVYRYYQTSTQLTQDAEVVIPPTDEAARNAFKYLAAGGCAGAVSRTCTAPFDRLKVFLITQTTVSATDSASNRAKSTLLSAMKTIYSQGGVRGFFVGNGLNVIKIVPESAIKFWAFESAKSVLARATDAEDKNSISVGARFIAGGMAGLCSQFSIYPLETLKTRIMSSKLISSSSPPTPPTSSRSDSLILTTARQMYRSGGIRAFWPGLTLGLIGVFPYQAMDLGIYETLKLTYLGYMDKTDGKVQQPNVFVLWGCGMVSGSIGATSVYPLSMIRTRLQAQGTPAHPQTYTSAWNAVQITYRKEGVRGFYKGLGPTLFKVVPAVSISYVVYEHSKRSLGIS
ncbi:unnamed protein product [Umbelopsis ramanniana]